jgi:DNA-binding NarL/FixJ family response regulator
MPTRILIVDDHEIFLEGLRALLEKQKDFQVVGEAHDGRAALDAANRLSPDVVIMDITMPGLNGIEATRQILAQMEHPPRVIALTMHSTRRFMAEVLKAGAVGYLLKESASAELILAIRTVIGGKAYLSPKITDVVVSDYVRHVPTDRSVAFAALTSREREVLQLVAEGKSNKEIAALLHVSVKTVEAHRAQLMEKLQIRSVAGLTKFAISEGLTPPEPD